jgi:hypothetical protein
VYYIINKLCMTCYAIRSIKHTVTTEMLKLIYFAHVHCVISYGIILGFIFQFLYTDSPDILGMKF